MVEYKITLEMIELSKTIEQIAHEMVKIQDRLDQMKALYQDKIEELARVTDKFIKDNNLDVET